MVNIYQTQPRATVGRAPIINITDIKKPGGHQKSLSLLEPKLRLQAEKSELTMQDHTDRFNADHANKIMSE